MNVEVLIENDFGSTLLRCRAEEGVLSIGRDASSSICLADSRVSRQHALVRVETDRLLVEDRSKNGTLAGDALLQLETAAIPFGTPIWLGFHSLTIRPVEDLHDLDSRVAAPPPSPLPEPLVTSHDTEAGVDADLRREIHRRLLEHLDLQATETTRLDDPSFRPRVLTALRRIVKGLDARLGADVDRDVLIGELADEALGLGPLEHLLSDPGVSEIMVIDADTIYVERSGKIVRSAARFTDDDRVRAVIERIVTPLGRRIDESSPLVDARLSDGSRVNAIIRPLALKGSCITIRKFSRMPLMLSDLYGFGALSEPMGRFLTRSVIAKKNIVISGGTGSGKTTLLNVLSSAIPEDERIVTIEDSAELKLLQPHVVSLESETEEPPERPCRHPFSILRGRRRAYCRTTGPATCHRTTTRSSSDRPRTAISVIRGARGRTDSVQAERSGRSLLPGRDRRRGGA